MMSVITDNVNKYAYAKKYANRLMLLFILRFTVGREEEEEEEED